ncbi:MAG: hypothetical protein H6Q73_824 [Firmicutes bacterium]|nr:hypothetical protein [Bacillota bacterium]
MRRKVIEFTTPFFERSFFFCKTFLGVLCSSLGKVLLKGAIMPGVRVWNCNIQKHFFPELTSGRT